jgi:sterol 3beta-glucosyltransferase
LKKGHFVRFATHLAFESLVRSVSGLNFFQLAGDPEELSGLMKRCYNESLLKLTLHLIPALPRLALMMRKNLDSCWDAFTTPILESDDSFNALISNPVSYAHVHIAEKTGLPLHIFFPQPWVRSKAMPHPLSGVGNEVGWSLQNPLSFDIIETGVYLSLETQINAFRCEVLGLNTLLRNGQGWDILTLRNVPFSGLFSPHLLPRPKDWRSNCLIAGTCYPTDFPTEYNINLSPLIDHPLIYMGFGSMALSDDEIIKFFSLIKDAVICLSVCFVFQLTSLSVPVLEMIHKLQEQLTLSVAYNSDDLASAFGNKIIVLACFMPHAELFKVCTAVIHHGGAGTTHISLLGGKPTMIIPFFADQNLWGSIVHIAGCGPIPLSLNRHNTHTFREGLGTLLAVKTKRAVAEMSRKLQSEENGSESAVRQWEAHLPLAHMICDVMLTSGETVLASVQCRQCGLQLCREVAHKTHGSELQCCSGYIQPLLYVDWEKRASSRTNHDVGIAFGGLAAALTKDATCVVYEHCRSVYLFTNLYQAQLQVMLEISIVNHCSNNIFQSRVLRLLMSRPLMELHTLSQNYGDGEDNSDDSNQDLFARKVNSPQNYEWYHDWVGSRDADEPFVWKYLTTSDDLPKVLQLYVEEQYVDTTTSNTTIEEGANSNLEELDFAYLFRLTLKLQRQILVNCALENGRSLEIDGFTRLAERIGIQEGILSEDSESSAPNIARKLYRYFQLSRGKDKTACVDVNDLFLGR